MINFKSREELAPSLLALGAILTLLGTLIYMMVVPVPTAAGLAKGRERSRLQIQDEIATAKKRADELESANQKRLWTGSTEAVTASVLDILTRQAKSRSLKLTAFRPQRTQALDGLTEMPCSVQLSGPFPAVRGVLSALDASNGKLALRSVQFASSDAASSAVPATVVVSAYMAGPPLAAKSTTSAPRSTSTTTTTGGKS